MTISAALACVCARAARAIGSCSTISAARPKRVRLADRGARLGAARTKAKDLLAHVRLGGDPATEKRTHRARAAETFAALLPRYLIEKQRDCRQSSFKQIERRLWKLAQPLHPLPITAIDRRTVASLIAAVADSNGPSAATNLHGTLSGYFSWLMGAGLLEQNPVPTPTNPSPCLHATACLPKTSCAPHGPRSATTITATSSSC